MCACVHVRVDLPKTLDAFAYLLHSNFISPLTTGFHNDIHAHHCVCKRSTLEQTITFGDGVNDLEMLRDAGLGIAMANARPEVKRVAKLTSQFTNEESAVAKEIATLLETGRVGAKQ